MPQVSATVTPMRMALIGNKAIWMEGVQKGVAVARRDFGGGKFSDASGQCSARVHDSDVKATFRAADDGHAVRWCWAQAEGEMAEFQRIGFERSLEAGEQLA